MLAADHVEGIHEVADRRSTVGCTAAGSRMCGFGLAMGGTSGVAL